MAITGIDNSGYTSYYATSYTKTVKKADCEQDSTGTKESGVTASTVELKTSTPGVTKTEQIKTGTSANSKDGVQEYYEKLCKKFPEITFNTGSSLMSGNENKVVINLSSECLKKMANDLEFAKKVEFNLTGAVPGQNRMFAQAKADNAVIHGVTTVIDADGNASVTCGGMTRTSGSKQNSTTSNAEKKQKERLEKKREEREKFEERMAEKQKEREEYLEKLTEDRGTLKKYYAMDDVNRTSYIDTNV